MKIVVLPYQSKMMGDFSMLKLKIVSIVFFSLLLTTTAFGNFDTSADLESLQPTHTAPPHGPVDVNNVPPRGWRKDEKTGWVCSRHGVDRKLCRDGKNLWNCYNVGGQWQCKSRASFRKE